MNIEMRVDSDLQLMLSIGKLTHLAQMQEDATVDESMLDGMYYDRLEVNKSS